MSEKLPVKSVVWMGNSLDSLQQFPDSVRNKMGYALYLAQIGQKHPSAKPLKGFSGTSVLEIVDNFDTNTYRAIYTVKFSSIIYVLHTFQKKSKKGIKTPKQDIDIVKKRLQAAKEHFQQHFSE